MFEMKRLRMVQGRGTAVRSRSLLTTGRWACALGVLAFGVMPRAALAAPCKADGEVCQTSRSCCGTSGNNGVCVKVGSAKFGLCCTPSAEVCGDGLDNDCDGVADDGCVCTPGSTASCTAGVGACAAGTKICNATGTAYGACVSDVTASAEVCDGLDNDCNGLVDDGSAQTSCMDTNACTIDEACTGGVCVHTQICCSYDTSGIRTACDYYRGSATCQTCLQAQCPLAVTACNDAAHYACGCAYGCAYGNPGCAAQINACSQCASACCPG